MPLKDLSVMENAPQSASHQALKVKVCIALSNILCSISDIVPHKWLHPNAPVSELA